ncbi:MAG: TRAP transporter small permease [Blautia sp.]|nr:TRAP transporter small permease [Blautia sp.]
MKKIIKWLDINFEACFGMIMFYVMLLIILYQIFARALIGKGFVWGEEVCRWCYVWVSYLGLSYATRNSIHIEIDAVRRLLPEKTQKILMIFTQFVMTVVFIYCFIGCTTNVMRIARDGNMALSIRVSQNWMYAAGPIGYGLGMLRSAQIFFWRFRHFNCSMPVFVNPYGVLNGGLGNFTYDEALREEYRQQVPEEAWAEEEAFRKKHGGKA